MWAEPETDYFLNTTVLLLLLLLFLIKDKP